MPPALRPADDAAFQHWLRSLDEDELTSLLQTRPELTWGPPPVNLTELGERLTHPSTVGHALADLDVAQTLVLHAVGALGWRADLDHLTDVFAPPDPREPASDDLRDRVAATVQQLRRLGLVAELPQRPGTVVTPFRAGEALRPVLPGVPLSMVVQHLSTAAAKDLLSTWGIRASPDRTPQDTVRETLSDEEFVIAIARAAPGDVVDAFVHSAAQDPDEGYTRYSGAQVRAEQEALQWAVTVGLAIPVSDGRVQIPTEVWLTLVGGRAGAELPEPPPPPTTVPVSPEVLIRTEAGTLSDVLSVTMSVLESVQRSGFRLRKDGTLGPRELTRAAKALSLDPALLRWSLWTASMLGLLTSTGDLTTTSAFETWRRTDAAHRLADLLSTWMLLPHLPVEATGPDGKAAAVFGYTTAPSAPALRRKLFERLAALPSGRGATEPAELFAAAVFAAPSWLDPGDAALWPTVWAEAELLGIIASGALTSVGHALVADDRTALVAHLERALPTVTSSASFGSDLTVLVSGEASADVVDLLDGLAVRESRGVASTWRFTDASLRGAFDRGENAEQILTALEGLSEKPLPQPLRYTVTEVERRYGRVAVRPAGSVLVGEEPLVAEIAGDSTLRRLGIHRVAPTVLVAAVDQAELLDRLRAAGYLPRAENPDGTRIGSVVPAGDEPEDEDVDDHTRTEAFQELVRRNEARRRRHPVTPAPPKPTPAATALRLLAGSPPPEDPALPRIVKDLVDAGVKLPDTQLRTLATAIAHGGAVSVEYRHGQFGYTEHLSEPGLGAGRPAQITGRRPHGGSGWHQVDARAIVGVAAADPLLG